MTDKLERYPYGIFRILSGRGRIHIVGIGGSMLRGMAMLLQREGYAVRGSDSSAEAVAELRALGLDAVEGHRAESLLPDTSLVIYTSAVTEENPELEAAEKRGIPAVSRAEFLGAYMTGYARRIGISGTHGKSTTTALTDFVAERAGCRPTSMLGALLPDVGQSVRVGGRELFVYEACEYRDSFLHFFPTDAVFLNMEWDHTDYFKTREQMENSYFAAMTRAEKRCIVNADDEGLLRLCGRLTVPAFTFGRNENADLCLTDVTEHKGHYSFTPVLWGRELDRVVCGEIGENAVCHAGAVLSVACLSGWDLPSVAKSIAAFSGIPRRLEVLRREENRVFYYDYAHHPSEISSVIRTLRHTEPYPVTAVFRPHTYTRTRDLFADFCRALGSADRVIVTDVFPAREDPIPGIDGKTLAEAVGARAEYCPLSALLPLVRQLYGTVVLLGAGDFQNLPKNIKNTLDKPSQNE